MHADECAQVDTRPLISLQRQYIKMSAYTQTHTCATELNV